jgi:hypothetical protein
MATYANEIPFVLDLHNPYSHEALFRLVVCWGSLPEGANLYLALGGTDPRGPLGGAGKDALEKAGVALGDGKARELFATALEARCGEPIRLDLDRVYRLSPERQRRTALPEILIASERPAVAALRLVLPNREDGARAQFDVVQMAGARVVGGCTFVVAGAQSPKPT